MPVEPLVAAGDARLNRCHDVPVGVRWPFPLEERLNQLLTLAEDAGERTNKTELVAALAYTSPTDAVGLSSALRSYRMASAADALLAAPADNLVRLTRRGPGPRGRRVNVAGASSGTR
jgi:hypothetical protein